MNITEFQKLVRDYYREHGREMLWRETTDPYAIVVSEVMLQQTQVARVLEKYPVFMAQFPNFGALAEAPTGEVIMAWQGLGYNRRALNLQRLAQVVLRDYGGQLPNEPAELVKLPGIGPHTAGSMAAFAYNYPSVFIETNIRRTFIHHFLKDGEAINDKQLWPLIESALDRDNPREWYWALMDYGAMLAKTVPNPNRRSRHYNVQSKFEGSDRQLRGQILRILTAGASDLAEITDERRERVINQLVKEGFIKSNGEGYSLS